MSRPAAGRTMGAIRQVRNPEPEHGMTFAFDGRAGSEPIPHHPGTAEAGAARHGEP